MCDFKNQTTKRLHPLISELSKRPKTSKHPSSFSFPKSCVAIKPHESTFARSIIFIAPVFYCLESRKDPLLNEYKLSSMVGI